MPHPSFLGETLLYDDREAGSYNFQGPEYRTFFPVLSVNSFSSDTYPSLLIPLIDLFKISAKLADLNRSTLIFSYLRIFESIFDKKLVYFLIMKKSILLLILLFTGSCIYAQKEFSTGWCQIVAGAQIAIIQGTSNDNGIDSNSWDVKTYKEGEILLAFAYSNDVYYCFDPVGRMVKVKGKSSLRKILYTGQPGYIDKDFRVNDKVTLYGKQTIWISAVNLQAQRAMILLKDGTKAGVDMPGLKFYTRWFDNISIGRPFVVAKP